MEQTDLDKKIKDIRRHIINMAGHSAHVAPSLSAVEILYTLFSGVMNKGTVADDNSDVFVLSKGHGCMALYATLAVCGYIEEDILQGYACNGSILAEHPLAIDIPGIIFATGTLGHGLSFAAGMAKAAKMKKSARRVFALLGDGECDEGSVWEAAAIASANSLDNLTVAIDRNGMQACGSCCNISPALDLEKMWASFGWHTEVADGHDYGALKGILSADNPGGRPRAVICNTTKGKGIDFMENNLEWHYRPVRGDEKRKALEFIDHA